MDVFGGILAGGGGTRFWPLSRKDRPKQFLNLSGNDLLLRETVARLFGVVSKENLYVLTARGLETQTQKALSGILKKPQIIAEPSARGTAAAIGYFAMRRFVEAGDSILLLLPSDAYIHPTDGFQRTLRRAIADCGERLTVIGIPPSFPATGYGYIEAGEREGAAFRVRSFREKPTEKTAEDYLRKGRYFWNSGILIARASVLLSEIERYLPSLYAGLMGMKDASEGELFTLYSALPATSIDYAVLEKSDRIQMLPADFSWNDVGSLDMLGVFHTADSAGNVRIGDCAVYSSCNNILLTQKRTLVAFGVEGLIVIDTPDAVLVTTKKQAQQIGKLTEGLRKDGYSHLL
ncbi:MAG: mannose-1-phosphate guanylyltransferase [Clostridia bacterium]|nr:mannose-1-phosphate guanylyltransferase [Clostridia bacterium]